MVYCQCEPNSVTFSQLRAIRGARECFFFDDILLFFLAGVFGAVPAILLAGKLRNVDDAFGLRHEMECAIGLCIVFGTGELTNSDPPQAQSSKFARPSHVRCTFDAFKCHTTPSLAKGKSCIQAGSITATASISAARTHFTCNKIQV